MKITIAIILLFSLFSCTKVNSNDYVESPIWYIEPKQNNSQNLYGVAEGFNLEDATKSALADLASKLVVSISSETSLTRQEDSNSSSEEMRQKVKQSVEKINFSNYKINKTKNINNKFYVEVEINRDSFVNEQKERVSFIEKKISDLDKNSLGKNPIQRRNSLIKINDLSKELELKAMIIRGAGEQFNLKDKLLIIAKYQNELAQSTDNIEFFFDNNSPKEIVQIIRNSLNKEKIKISTKLDKNNENQVIIKIENFSKTNHIYESHITKTKIDFESLCQGKILASNSLEVTGNSSINEKESYIASLKTLEEKIEKDGVLKTLGIIN